MNAGERARLTVETAAAARHLLAANRGTWHITIDGKTVAAGQDPADLYRHRTTLEQAGKAVVVHQHPSNLTNLLNAQPGLSANHEPGTGEGDPTGNSVDRPDQPAWDLYNRDRYLHAAFRALDAIRRIDANYGPARPAGEAERLALQRDNAKAEPCCDRHAEITEPHSTLPLLVPPDPRRKGPTTVGGRLSKKRLLCSWCVGFVEANGRLPNDDELKDHRDRTSVKLRTGGSTRRPA